MLTKETIQNLKQEKEKIDVEFKRLRNRRNAINKILEFEEPEIKEEVKASQTIESPENPTIPLWKLSINNRFQWLDRTQWIDFTAPENLKAGEIIRLIRGEQIVPVHHCTALEVVKVVGENIYVKKP